MSETIEALMRQPRRAEEAGKTVKGEPKDTQGGELRRATCVRDNA